MAGFSEIQKIISELPLDFRVEEIDLKNAFNRILQEDVLSDTDMPPFNKSAMDGYACRLEDLENKLEVLETIQAGKVASKQAGKNQCFKIMTGAAVPKECDCVFKVEDAEVREQNYVICTNPSTARNICYRGEDFKTGEVLIKSGTIINTSHIAVMAGVGKVQLKVSAKPKISVIATGSELVEPEETPVYGKIRNSNASQLISQLSKMNIDAKYVGIAVDDYELLTHLFKSEFEKSDMVIFTGGASVGDFDFIPQILKDQDFKILWERTGIKPGNPMTFSYKKNKYCFGLSGNPVSSLVQFETIAKPAIYRLLGANFVPTRIKAPIAFDVRLKKADRLNLKPVVINTEGEIEEIPFNGSAHINALVYANALLEIQVEQNHIQKGELVYVRPF
jgi:molybdopterin molybdotransferase